MDAEITWLRSWIHEYEATAEIVVYGTEWNACFLAGLLRSFLAIQNGTNQLIFLCYVHWIASRIRLLELPPSVILQTIGPHYFGGDYGVKRSEGNVNFLRSGYANLYKRSPNSA